MIAVVGIPLRLSLETVRSEHRPDILDMESLLLHGFPEVLGPVERQFTCSHSSNDPPCLFTGHGHSPRGL